MPTASKTALREQLLAARGGVADAVRAAEARMLSDHLERAVSSGGTVCAYVPVGTEPGSIEMLDMLLRRAARVLLPVACTGDDDTPVPLRWGDYRPGRLIRVPGGLPEPGGPWLPASAVAGDGRVLGAGLAVDRGGVRLGRGRGFYDRTLGGRDPQARLVAMVRDEEFIDELPAEPHDVRMTHVITPGRGMIQLTQRF